MDIAIKKMIAKEMLKTYKVHIGVVTLLLLCTGFGAGYFTSKMGI